MSLKLQDFIAEQQKQLDEFLAYWTLLHQQEPDNFPLEMPDGNEGAWLDQLLFFNPQWLQDELAKQALQVTATSTNTDAKPDSAGV